MGPQRLAILGSLAALRVPQEDGADSHALLDNLLHACQSSSVRACSPSPSSLLPLPLRLTGSNGVPPNRLQACMAFLYDELAALVQEGAIDEKLVDKLSQYLAAAAAAAATAAVEHRPCVRS